MGINVLHRTTNNLCYMINEDELEINILTSYNVQFVYLCWNDPYISYEENNNVVWKSNKEKPRRCIELPDNKMWRFIIKPLYKRCKYYFMIFTDNEKYLYFENGLINYSNKLPEFNLLSFFTYSWMNPADLNQTPNWLKNVTWYQIIIDKFNNYHKDKLLNNDLYLETKHINDINEGGDIRGIQEKIPYLHELGVQGIYLSPICKANSVHKYDVISYEEIDQDLGTEKELIEMIKYSHSYNMKVMFDGVFNHVSDQSVYWKDVITNGKDSKYFDWFFINEWPINNANDTSYYTYAFFDDLPKLNTNNDEVISYLIDRIIKWIRVYDIDGLRIDVGNEVSHKFIRELRTAVKKEKEDFFLLGETWMDSIEWLKGDQYDSIMNYKLKNCIDLFWHDGSMSNKEFMRQINYCYALYMNQTTQVMFNLLDSHDTDRLLTRSKNNINVFLQKLALIFLLPGTPCIMYGTEIGLNGELNSCRVLMNWDNNDKHYLYNYVKTLINIKKNNVCYEYAFINNYENDRIVDILFVCENNNDVVLLINCSESSLVVNLENSKILLSNLLNNNILESDGFVIYQD